MHFIHMKNEEMITNVHRHYIVNHHYDFGERKQEVLQEVLRITRTHSEIIKFNRRQYFRANMPTTYCGKMND